MVNTLSFGKRNKNIVREIKKTFLAKQDEIYLKLEDFKRVWHKEDGEIFTELVFCLLTPQSKARTCWDVVVTLKKKGLIWNGDRNNIANELVGVRFKNKKASYIVKARKLFSKNGKITIKSKLKLFDDAYKLRDWLVHNVKGIGYKEASHFLRNIGLGENMAILDRHILKNLNLLGVTDDVPSSLSKKRYFEIENRMMKFSSKINIPMSYLDLVLWYKETGETFK
ncbi:MAG: N-glycosylase/DNA lyase [Candidatus Aenigmarchaeota archaeon]|nr:N-glycosylase/DNA lyase [Candidatus Aenigmarchaeota archaeon]